MSEKEQQDHQEPTKPVNQKSLEFEISSKRWDKETQRRMELFKESRITFRE